MIQKKSWLVVAVLVTPLLVTFFALGHGNEHGQTTAKIGQGTVSVEYHSPLAKGRDLMSMIQPGIYWRMGADSATILKTEVDLNFGGTTVSKGEYTLSAHFADSESWSLVLSKSPGRRGAKPEDVLAEAPGTLGKTQAPVESMTIELSGHGSQGTLVLEWGNSRLSVDFTAA
jgi:hypothetical protein